MIENVGVVGYRNSRLFQFRDRIDYAALCHIPRGIIVHANDKYPGVLTARCRHDFVEIEEVIVISGHENERVSDGMDEVPGVGSAGQRHVGGEHELVTGLSKSSY